MQLRAFVDELARCGLRDACTSPGSRNTPILLALANEQRLRCHSHIDERTSGFFALGAAKASGRPVVVTCTSGTAAAQFLPAVIEAHEARVPLIVITADRPPELRDVGAGQAIDQIKLFGDAVKWFCEVGTHDTSPASLRWWRTLACRAFATASEGRPGAVHLNVPLREPLVVDEPLPGDDSGRPDGRPFLTRRIAAGSAAADPTLRELVEGARRGVLVAGRHERATPLAHEAARFAAAVGWPLLADPLSGARRGPAAVAHYDALLRDTGFAATLAPDVVVRVGDLPPSKPLRTWLATAGEATHIAIDDEQAWQDPDGILSYSFALEPAAALGALADATSAPVPDDWMAAWRRADDHAAGALTSWMAGDEVTEPWLAVELAAQLHPATTLFVASSMPVRDLESFWPRMDPPPRVLCHRGANGIDGTVAGALGAAAVTDGPVVLLIGDVALAHDIGSLAASGRGGHPLTIVLVNNDGGGIFDFLPIAATPSVSPAVLREHVTTPPGLDFSHAAALGGADYRVTSDRASVRDALSVALAGSRTTLIEVRTQRDRNVELHREAWSVVRGAVRDEG